VCHVLGVAGSVASVMAADVNIEPPGGLYQMNLELDDVVVGLADGNAINGRKLGRYELQYVILFQ
jgi:hypothetical protein